MEKTKERIDYTTQATAKCEGVVKFELEPSRPERKVVNKVVADLTEWYMGEILKRIETICAKLSGNNAGREALTLLRKIALGDLAVSTLICSSVKELVKDRAKNILIGQGRTRSGRLLERLFAETRLYGQKPVGTTEAMKSDWTKTLLKAGFTQEAIRTLLNPIDYVEETGDCMTFVVQKASKHTMNNFGIGGHSTAINATGALRILAKGKRVRLILAISLDRKNAGWQFEKAMRKAYDEQPSEWRLDKDRLAIHSTSKKSPISVYILCGAELGGYALSGKIGVRFDAVTLLLNCIATSPHCLPAFQRLVSLMDKQLKTLIRLNGRGVIDHLKQVDPEGYQAFVQAVRRDKTSGLKNRKLARLGLVILANLIQEGNGKSYIPSLSEL